MPSRSNRVWQQLSAHLRGVHVLHESTHATLLDLLKHLLELRVIAQLLQQQHLQVQGCAATTQAATAMILDCLLHKRQLQKPLT